MAYSTDADLLKYQPYVFEHGMSSFAAYHADAEADINRDIQILWLPAQSSFFYPCYPLMISGLPFAEFDATKLNPAQWMKASVFKVLAAYVLPSLAASIGGEGFVAMIAFYERNYVKELENVFSAGVQYLSGSEYAVIYAKTPAERQRLVR
ncbi:MAG: hypothetical protein WCI81_04065 [Chlorobiaceae bacterium]